MDMTKRLRKKYRKLNVLWSSSCAPCIAEFPELEKTYSQYKEKGLNILLISIDKNRDDFQTAMKKYQIKFNSLIDTTEGQRVKENFPFSGIPHGILINSSGEIVANQLHSALLKKKLEELWSMFPTNVTKVR